MPYFLLGIGSDGHTGPLIPSHELLTEEDCWVACIKEDSSDVPRHEPCAGVAFVGGKTKVLSAVLGMGGCLVRGWWMFPG
jgi:6-phosphogluconolactonase/glucosamine-6-phosphate isomerase/deaminase